LKVSLKYLKHLVTFLTYFNARFVVAEKYSYIIQIFQYFLNRIVIIIIITEIFKVD